MLHTPTWHLMSPAMNDVDAPVFVCSDPNQEIALRPSAQFSHDMRATLQVGPGISSMDWCIAPKPTIGCIKGLAAPWRLHLRTHEQPDS